MTDKNQETKNDTPTPAVESPNPIDVPAEHAVFVVPVGLLQSIANYLATKPYQEVVQFLQALSKIPASDCRKLEK